MKKKLLAIGLITMCGVNLQASSLQETIASNPVTCAAVVGFALGATYQSWGPVCNSHPYALNTHRFKDPIALGLATAVVCGGLALWATKK